MHSEEAERRTEAASWRQEGFYSRGPLLARVRLRADDMWEHWERVFHWTNCLFTSTAPIPWCHWVMESWTLREIIASVLTGGHWLIHLSTVSLNLHWVHKKFCQVQVLYRFSPIATMKADYIIISFFLFHMHCWFSPYQVVGVRYWPCVFTLAGTNAHSRSDKASLSGTKSVYCGQLPDIWGWIWPITFKW